MSRDPHLWATVTLKPAQSGSFFVFNISVNAIACEVSHPMMPTFTTSSPHVTAAVSATAHIIVFIIVGCSFREGNWSRQRDSNPRPAVYKTAALPLRYTGPKGKQADCITFQRGYQGEKTRLEAAIDPAAPLMASRFSSGVVSRIPARGVFMAQFLFYFPLAG